MNTTSDIRVTQQYIRLHTITWGYTIPFFTPYDFLVSDYNSGITRNLARAIFPTIWTELTSPTLSQEGENAKGRTEVMWKKFSMHLIEQNVGHIYHKSLLYFHTKMARGRRAKEECD